MAVKIADSATIEDHVTIGPGSAVWDQVQIRSGAQLGQGCIIGRGAYIGAGVRLGDYCKVQNHALIYEPAQLADGVFIGPAVVLTNDQYPRAINPDGTRKSAEDWDPVGVEIGQGAAIGARAVCVAPVKIGRWATVAAGSVVIKDVPDFALVAGVPATFKRWVGKAGVPLIPTETEGTFRCPATAEEYLAVGDKLIPSSEHVEEA